MKRFTCMTLFLFSLVLTSCVDLEREEQDLVDLLVFSGQSNMQGKSLDHFPTSGFQTENDNTYEYKHLTKSYVPCIHPVGETIPNTGLEWAENEISSVTKDLF